MNKKGQLSRKKIFAHRGANREAAENTRLAFDKALNYSIDGIETDVQLSRDEVPVLWHDRFMDKLGYPDKRIDDFDFSQLQQMDFTSFYTGRQEPEGVTSLQEFIDTYRGQCGLQIEVKNREWEDLSRHQIKMRKTLDIIGSVADHEVFISSFNFESLVYAAEYSEKVPLYYAVREEYETSKIENFLNEHSFLKGMCLPIEIINMDIIQLLHQQGKGLATYTCNSDEKIAKALLLEVDILITDDAQKALALRDQC